ncbi:MAG: flagellin [Tepidisphaeraceae bacterium]
MSRINTNVPSLIAQRVLTSNNTSLNQSLQRLSTGLKINSGKDDPSGLIASENLRAEETGIKAGIANAERASNIVGTAEGGLAEISSLLNEVQSLVTTAANTGGLSSDEVDANQQQVDSILNTINRLAGSTSFQGSKLLDGSLDYTTSSVSTSAISNLQINGARLTDGTTKSIVVTQTGSAQTGTISFTASATTSANTIEVAGSKGSTQLSFAAGATDDQIAAAIAAVKDVTGVSASVTSGGGVTLSSTSYGSNAFVTLRSVSGTEFDSVAGTDYGQDATVTVNGASAQVDGLNVKVRSADLDVEFDLAADANTGSATSTFGITGGGANFSIGAKVTENAKAAIGIKAVTTGALGNSSLGFLTSLASGAANDLSSGNLTKSQAILDKAITQVSQLRGRLGAFQKFTIGSTVNSLNIALENVQASDSAIRDTDFAEETSKLTRAQILSSAASTVLAQANSAPQSALSLLR